MARSREKREIACAVFFKAPLFIFFVALFFEIARRARRNALRFPRFFLGPRDRNSFCAFSRFFPFDELVNGDIAALSPKNRQLLRFLAIFFLSCASASAVSQESAALSLALAPFPALICTT